MTLTATKLAQVATGWTDSIYATDAGTEVATAACPSSGGAFTQSPSLVLEQFQLDAFGVDLINSLFIRVCAKSDASNPVLNVYLARNGVQKGSIKTIALTSTLQEMTLGGDLWGTTLTDADCYNLQVTCYVTALDGGTHSISYCTARADVPAGDAIPTAFTLTPQTGVALSTLTTSNSVTVAGTTINSCVSIEDGEWEKNASGVWNTADGSVTSGDTVKVRLTSSATAGMLKSAALTIGSASASFNVTTTTADTTPDAYTFPTLVVAGAPLASWIYSGQTTITGITGPAPVTITGGEYSIEGGTYTSAAGTISNGQKIEVRCLSSATFYTLTSCTPNIGGVTQLFVVESVRKYGTFTPHFFTTQTGVPLTTLVTSNTITLTGWAEFVNVTISGGTYSKNGGAYGSGALTCADGNTISIQHTSSGAINTVVSTTLTCTGATSGVVYATTFSSGTAGADLTPDAFAFTAQTNVAQTQVMTSNTQTITGIVGSVPVVATNGGTVSIAGGAYAANGTITTGQTLTARVTSSAQPGYTTTTNVTVGTVTQAFSVTTDYVINADF